MHRGYIKIWRKTQDSGLFQLPNAFTLFAYMLTEATHKPVRFGTVDLQRGQLVTGRHKLASSVGVSEQSIRTALKQLHDLNMIQSESTNKYTIYTIVNYSNYQDFDSDQPTNNQQLTNEQPTSNQQLTTIQTHKHINTKEHNKEITFDEFLKTCEEKCELPIPEDDAVYAWAEKVRIPLSILFIGWTAFKKRDWKDAKGKVKKYKDWRQTFRNYCKQPDWLNVWSINREGEYFLTAAGKQLEREIGGNA